MKKYIQLIIIVYVSFTHAPAVYSQDGEGLFKAKCNTCHILEKNSTGPNLKGVKQKWIDGGEQENLYAWVKNSNELIMSGKSVLAKAIENFSTTKMPAQIVTNEEVDAILDYVDNYVKEEKVYPPKDGDVEVIIGPNYHSNLNQFYFLIALTILLFIAIFIMSTSIKTLIHSDYFIERMKHIDEEKKGNGGLKTLLALIVFVGLTAMPSHALEFMQPGQAKEGMPWLLVENRDLIVFIVIDLILLGVVLYLRRMFKEFARMANPEVEEKVAVAPVFKKVNAVLTDAVPIEEEASILMHHEYDGIRELDNNLPPWWLWGFYATIVFAIIYVFNYHILGTSDLQIAAYKKDMKQSEIEVQEYLSKMAMNVDENTATLMTESADLDKGKTLFEVNCVTCHGPSGGGEIGPNLTDKNWIYGFEIGRVFKTIKEGAANGMPEHGSKLNPVQIQQVASYVLQLEPVSGKPAEGDIIEE